MSAEILNRLHRWKIVLAYLRALKIMWPWRKVGLLQSIVKCRHAAVSATAAQVPTSQHVGCQDITLESYSHIGTAAA